MLILYSDSETKIYKISETAMTRITDKENFFIFDSASLWWWVGVSGFFEIC